MTTGEKVFVAALITVSVLVGGIAIFLFNDRAEECEKAGGVLIKTAGGFVCAELRRVL